MELSLRLHATKPVPTHVQDYHRIMRRVCFLVPGEILEYTVGHGGSLFIFRGGNGNAVSVLTVGEMVRSFDGSGVGIPFWADAL